MNTSRFRRTAVRALALIAALGPAFGQQVPDPKYAPRVERPEYARDAGPRVVVDAAHLNFHTADGGFAPFAKLLRADGYRVESNTQPFTSESLSKIDILVIANALHESSRKAFAPLPSLPAFKAEEIAALEAWVRDGGALFLIADHMPIAGHAESLAAAFKIRFRNGFAFNAQRNGTLTFRRDDGTLPASSAADGRGPPERVDAVTSFTGQAFSVDPGVSFAPVLKLRDDDYVLMPQVAFQFTDATPREPGKGLLQGALVKHGKGRIAVFGEAAMFTAQLAGKDRIPVGMNLPDARDNAQLALNTLHWLSATKGKKPTTERADASPAPAGGK